MEKAIPIRVVIADDHELMRNGLIQLLSSMEEVKLVGECANGKRLVQIVQHERPDMVITDIKMPLMDGIEATKELRKIAPNTQVLAISFFDNEYLIVKMLEAGALGYMVKDSTKEEMAEAIRTVARGKPYYCDTTSTLLARLINESRFDPYSKTSPALIDEREIEIVRLFCEEKTCQEVGSLLNKSVRTIEEYRSKIFMKMGVRNLAGMVIYAVKNGIYEVR
jgi:two-component system response regulator NreC